MNSGKFLAKYMFSLLLNKDVSRFCLSGNSDLRIHCVAGKWLCEEAVVSDTCENAFGIK